MMQILAAPSEAGDTKLSIDMRVSAGIASNYLRRFGLHSFFQIQEQDNARRRTKLEIRCQSGISSVRMAIGCDECRA